MLKSNKNTLSNKYSTPAKTMRNDKNLIEDELLKTVIKKSELMASATKELQIQHENLLQKMEKCDHEHSLLLNKFNEVSLENIGYKKEIYTICKIFKINFKQNESETDFSEIIKKLEKYFEFYEKINSLLKSEISENYIENNNDAILIFTDLISVYKKYDILTNLLIKSLNIENTENLQENIKLKIDLLKSEYKIYKNVFFIMVFLIYRIVCFIWKNIKFQIFLK